METKSYAQSTIPLTNPHNNILATIFNHVEMIGRIGLLVHFSKNLPFLTFLSSLCGKNIKLK
jgi:hypothetical protein